MVVTITRDGFIKRTPLETFRQQNRGGRGRSAASHARRRHRHAQLQCAHASVGAVLLVRRQGVPLRKSGSCRKRSRARKAARWSTCCRNSAATPSPPCCRCRRTRRCGTACISCSRPRMGNVRRNRLSDFRNVRSAGLIAMKLDEGDRLIGVATCRDGDDVHAGDAFRPLHPLPDQRRDAARVRRPRQFGRARHPARPAASSPTRSSACRSCATSMRAPRSGIAYLKVASARRRNGEDEPEPVPAEAEEVVARRDAHARSASPSWKRPRSSC